MQKIAKRSEVISPTLNAWQVECWTIDRDLCEVMGGLANDPTCLELQKLQLDLLDWNMPRRYLVWLEPPGTQICMRLESCWAFRHARGKLEIRKGLARCFFEPVWVALDLTILVNPYNVYRTFSYIFNFFDYSQWFCLWRAKPLGYPADDVDSLLAGQMATAEVSCPKRSRVTWIYLLPRWFKRWIQFQGICGLVEEGLRVWSLQGTWRNTWNCNTSKRFKALLTCFAWKVRQRQAQASNTDHRPRVIVSTSNCTFSSTFVVVPSVSCFRRLKTKVVEQSICEANRAQKLHMDNWWVLCSCQICSAELTRWNDETKQTWSNHELVSLSHFHVCSFRCTSCYCLLLLKIPEMNIALRYSKFHEVKNESLATATWRQSSEWRSLGAQWASSSPVVRFLSIGIARPLRRYTSI